MPATSAMSRPMPIRNEMLSQSSGLPYVLEPQISRAA
jgi:hypothetical protein